MTGTSFYQTILDAPVLSGKPDSCAVSKQAFGQSFGDTNKQVNALRTGTCLADKSLYAEEIEALNATKSKLTEEYTTQKQIFEAQIASIGILQNARGPFDTYYQDLLEEQRKLEKENYEIQQRIRAGRRRFIDAGPQDGLFSFLGIKTADDKALLGFWVAYLVGISLATLAILQTSPLSVSQKSTTLLGVILLGATIAYFIIRYFA